MSSSARASSQEKFVCALCLDMFSDPATIPCGHSFCLPCIARYWELSSDTGKANCPQCLRTFTPIPTLQKNLTLCEILEDLQASGEISSGSHPAGPGDVTCDICTKTKVKGRKSCLDCLLTYCGPHLQPHHQEAALKDHVLVDPIKHLHTQRDCAAHGEPLDWFCRTEGESICRLCVAEQHIIHDVVTVPEEVAQQQELILRNSSTLKQQLQKTLAEISDLQVNVDSVKNSSQEVRTEITQKFTAMVKLIEEAHKEAIVLINNDEQVTLGQAKTMRAQLQQRCTELTAREDQLRTLLKINDNLIFLQESSCVKTRAQPLESPQFQQTDAQSTMACVKVSVNDLATSIKQQVISFCKQIQDKQNIGRTCSETKQIRPANPKKVMIKKGLQCYNLKTGMTKEDFIRSTPSIMEAPQSGRRMELLRYAESLRFDVRSAHCLLNFHNSYQTVSSLIELKYPDDPLRFNVQPQILCENRWFNLKRYYCEVEVYKPQTTNHICIGITSPCIQRKGADTSCILGRYNQSWCLDLFLTPRNTFLVFGNGVESEVPRVAYNRIGMSLEANTLSFYGVTDTMNLIHKFSNVHFKEAHPAFRIEDGTALSLCQPQ
ncbi:E3 ubiquitin/ISG15 ligase TRIM25-like [Chiloscyllium plagiosum]|uniref:E3 ubiquitin/ISG15 ligase TRIM25-like n=1 Tax=Chiloscyllium plagiosum TaxID=36176 RepID=UPI001CB881CC|nr:E3 ubiquitin/ISG15 ligase TRIM25-like [Chiloscyllium plagiosum]